MKKLINQHNLPVSGVVISDSEEIDKKMITLCCYSVKMPDKAVLFGTFAIILWMTCGYVMIIFNKLVLSTWGFSFPFFITGWHILIATIGTQILARLTNFLPGIKEGKISTKAVYNVLAPAACFSCLSVVLSNTAYQYISVGYIQMIKAVMPVPLLLMYFMQGREKLSYVQLLIVCIISLGVIISSVGELEFTWIGFSIQFTAVLCDCARVISLDGALKDLAVDALSVLYYTAPNSLVLISIGCLCFESSRLYSTTEKYMNYQFLGILLLNSAASFTLNFATLLAMSATNGIIVSVCGQIKNVCVIATSSIIFGSPVT